MSVGSNVRRIRKIKGYSILKIREITGLSKSTISEIENDKSSPTIATLEKLAEALNVSLDYLLKKSPVALIEENLKDMTMQDLADKTNLTVEYLNNLDNIIPDEKDYENMKRVSEILGVDLTSALGLQEPPTYECSTNAPQDDFGTVNEPQSSYSISEFKTPEAAMKFILAQPSIMGFGGFDVNKMNDEQVLEFANELLRQLKLISYKYK